MRSLFRVPRVHAATLAVVVALLGARPSQAEPLTLTLDESLLVDAALLVGLDGLDDLEDLDDLDDLVQSGGSGGGGGGGGGTKRTTGGARKNDPEPAGPLIQPGSGLGIGLQIGTPTAVTVKLPTAGADVVVGIGAGYAFNRRGFIGLSLHGDYLLTVAQLTATPDFNVTAYLGPGIWVTLFTGGYGYGFGYYYTFNDFIGLGARFPLGANVRFNTAPVEVYLELDPALFVFPGVDIFLGASLGFRWFF